MLLTNATPFLARFLRCPRTEVEMHGVVLVKATFERDQAGRLVPAAEQVPIVGERLDTPFGVFHTEMYLRKDGVDICVLGTLRSARRERMRRVRLTVGPLVQELTVFGDRRWVRRDGNLVPSDPERFEEMALDYEHAYGGQTEHDHEAVVWTDNPVGRGYYMAETVAEGGLLPNIEAAAEPLLRAWNDRPIVAGWGPYPMFWGLRMREGLDVSNVTAGRPLPKIRQRLNNNAHPSLIVPMLDQDAIISLQGLRDQDLSFELPRIRPTVEVRCGEEVQLVEGRIDGVVIWADSGRITVTHRAHFDYTYNRGQVRSARLMDVTQRGS
jgi:hypothetical protein